MATRKKASHTLSTDERNQMSDSTYAFPEERKEPLNNASHVRNAIARLDQVKGVSAGEKKTAVSRIKTAAKKFGVKMTPGSASAAAKKSPRKENGQESREEDGEKVVRPPRAAMSQGVSRLSRSAPPNAYTAHPRPPAPPPSRASLRSAPPRSSPRPGRQARPVPR